MTEKTTGMFILAFISAIIINACGIHVRNGDEPKADSCCRVASPLPPVEAQKPIEPPTHTSHVECEKDVVCLEEYECKGKVDCLKYKRFCESTCKRVVKCHSTGVNQNGN